MKLRGKDAEHVLWCLDFVDGYYGGEHYPAKSKKRNRRLAKKLAKQEKVPKKKRTGSNEGGMLF